MPADIDTLLRRMIGGDPQAATEIVDLASSTECPRLLVAAAVINSAARTTTQQQLLTRAQKSAVTTRDRQLVAVATAHLEGADDLLDVLVREHLSDFPDNILVAWIASQH